MRIAFISTNDHVPWGGSEELWAQTAGSLKSKGIDVAANVQYWNPIPAHLEKNLVEKGIEIWFRNSAKTYLRRGLDKIHRLALGINDSHQQQYHVFFNSFKPDSQQAII